MVAGVGASGTCATGCWGWVRGISQVSSQRTTANLGYRAHGWARLRDDGQKLYFVWPELRSSSRILAMFAAMRRVSLRLPERLRRLALVT